MGETSPALKVIPSLGLVEASFPQNQPAWLVRGGTMGASPALHVFQGGWLEVFKHFGIFCFRGNYSDANYSLTYLFIKVLPQGLKPGICTASLIRSPDPCESSEITVGHAGLRLSWFRLPFFLLPAEQSQV